MWVLTGQESRFPFRPRRTRNDNLLLMKVEMIDCGLIGFGLGGRAFHAPFLATVPGLRLAAVLQRTGDDAARIYPGTKIVRTPEELLAIPSIQLIAISTPNHTHAPL